MRLRVEPRRRRRVEGFLTLPLFLSFYLHLALSRRWKGRRESSWGVASAPAADVDEISLVEVERGGKFSSVERIVLGNQSFLHFHDNDRRGYSIRKEETPLVDVPRGTEHSREDAFLLLLLLLVLVVVALWDRNSRLDGGEARRAIREAAKVREEASARFSAEAWRDEQGEGSLANAGLAKLLAYFHGGCLGKT